MSVLVIGSGGREHALTWKLSHSSSVKHIYVAPGNAGTLCDGSGKVSNIALNIKDNEQIATWCKEKEINLVVVGPEDPLANGLADYLTKNKIKCFGPCQKAAEIEASKEFAKHFMDRHKIPTARWKSFTCAEEAKNHILSASYGALVVKASGLAAGKGVIVANSKEEAAKAVDSLKQDKGLSTASETIVIEELLEGEETSVLCFSDGTHISVMPPAQDHKRLLDNDEGPNTGGMGAYSKCPQVSEETLKFVRDNVLQRAIDGMKTDGIPYVGVLYAGLMMTSEGPKVLEFNCRFGDPETQVVLPLLKSDLYQIMLDCVNGTLDDIQVQWSTDKSAVGVVVVSGGYPGSYPKGKIITGLDKLTSNYIVFHAGTSMNSGNVVTSGGRVLAVVAVEDTLQEAASKAESGAALVNFDGAFYRKDIAHKALKRSYEGMTYKSSGVDIESADALVDTIKTLTKQTLRPGVCGGIGGFGGIFDLKAAGFGDVFLVSRGTGIGEKLLAAQECGKYESLGYDLVSNCVNEIICQGAEPLFFLDTFTTGKLNTTIAANVIQGIVRGCKEANCALIGGETAEMPGMYADGDFDLTGFARGAVNKELLLPQKNEIVSGDSVIGLLSSAVNSSSFKIIRKVLKREGLTYGNPAPFAENMTVEESVLCENKIHVQSILPLVKKKCIKAAAYINEGGLSENLKRILPTSHKISLDASKWMIPSIFRWVAEKGNFSDMQMLENFSCGIDMVLIASESLKSSVLESMKSSGESAVVLGTVHAFAEGDKKIHLLNSPFTLKRSLHKIKAAVFTSGPGSNTEALIDYTQNPSNVSISEISLVISESNESLGLLNAKKANIPIKVFNSKDFTENLDTKIQDCLKSNNIDIICIDNFSFQLSDNFVKSWQGKILSIHPSLLPAFETPNAHKEVLEMKARITGCTAFFLEPERRFGGIIEQAATLVETDDTEDNLHKKVTQLQQYVYPKALELVASKRIFYGPDSKLKRIDDDYSSTSDSIKSHSDTLQKKIYFIIKDTARPGFKDIDSSCGIFDLKASGYDDPLLVSGTDGVGTKLKIAQICNQHDTIGIDLVAMCVNDILTHGAEPLFFMQCFNYGQLNPDIATAVISGIANGCKQANCTLINSEISLLPDIYLNRQKCIPDFGNYDVVGYAEGALSKENLLPRMADIKENDILIGLASSGIHSNGYSLVRKLVKIRNLRYQDPAPFDTTKTLGQVLLAPTKIYVKSLLPLMKKGYIKAAAHITGGGITENIPRVLPPEYKVVLDGHKWLVPSVLKWIALEGQMSNKEMLKTFNCGLGMVLIVSPKHEKEILEHLKSSGEIASNVGNVRKQVKGEEKVEVKNFDLNIHSTNIKKKKVGVLISGSGTNLQALIDYTQNPSNQSKAEIVLVLSNVPGVEGLKRAERAHIPTKVLSHKEFKTRVDFDMSVNSVLQKSGVEIICLAGFMRILSKKFVQIWQGKLLNVHPAILPAFKGMNAHKQVLEMGARITGCTVHFVEPEVDAGAIIEQAAVRVDISDTEKSLQEKVKVLEHQIFPTALELLASEKIARGHDGKLVWQF